VVLSASVHHANVSSTASRRLAARCLGSRHATERTQTGGHLAAGRNCVHTSCGPRDVVSEAITHTSVPDKRTTRTVTRSQYRVQTVSFHQEPVVFVLRFVHALNWTELNCNELTQLHDVTREYASCGILWCRRTPPCKRRINRSVSGRSSCSIGSALQHRTFNDYINNITV